MACRCVIYSQRPSPPLSLCMRRQATWHSLRNHDYTAPQLRCRRTLCAISVSVRPSVCVCNNRFQCLSFVLASVLCLVEPSYKFWQDISLGLDFSPGILALVLTLAFDLGIVIYVASDLELCVSELKYCSLGSLTICFKSANFLPFLSHLPSLGRFPLLHFHHLLSQLPTFHEFCLIFLHSFLRIICQY